MEKRIFPTINYSSLLALIVLSLSLFRICYILWGPLDLAPEEAQYWEWSRRLDLSYYSKGPVIAYIIALSTSIFGNTEFGVRIPSVIISAVLTIIIFLFADALFQNKRIAFFSALVPNLTPLFSAGSLLMTTDTPLLLFWALSHLAFFNAVNKGKTCYWVLAGACVGLGLLTKYTMALIYPSFFLFLLLSSRDRFWLGKKEPYVALFVSLIVFMPELLWNMENDWVTFKHVMGQSHVKDEFHISMKNFLGFSGAQLGILTPFIFFGVLYGMYRACVNALKGSREYLLLFLSSAPVLAFFLVKSLQSKVEANWAAFAYFTGIVAGVAVLDSAYNQRSRSGRGSGFLKSYIFITIFLGVFFVIISFYPVMLKYVGLELHIKKPIVTLKGWQELGRKVSDVTQELSKQGDTFILSDRYQIASELAFYVPGHPTTYNIKLGRRMNQYDLWEGFYDLKGWNAVYVEWSRGPLRGEVREVFDECLEEPVFEIIREGKAVRKFYIYRCFGFKGMEPPGFEKW